VRDTIIDEGEERGEGDLWFAVSCAVGVWCDQGSGSFNSGWEGRSITEFRSNCTCNKRNNRKVELIGTTGGLEKWVLILFFFFIVEKGVVVHAVRRAPGLADPAADPADPVAVAADELIGSPPSP